MFLFRYPPVLFPNPFIDVSVLREPSLTVGLVPRLLMEACRVPSFVWNSDADESRAIKQAYLLGSPFMRKTPSIARKPSAGARKVLAEARRASALARRASDKLRTRLESARKATAEARRASAVTRTTSAESREPAARARRAIPQAQSRAADTRRGSSLARRLSSPTSILSSSSQRPLTVTGSSDRFSQSHRGFSPVSGQRTTSETVLNGFQSQANAETPR
jgi:hypothetical protein